MYQAGKNILSARLNHVLTWPHAAVSRGTSHVTINTQGNYLTLEIRYTTQQQRPESPTITLTYGMRVNTRYINSTRGTSSIWLNLLNFQLVDIPLVELIHLVLHEYQVRVTVGDSDMSLLLYLCYVFGALINSLVRWFCTSALGLVLFQIHLTTKQRCKCTTSVDIQNALEITWDDMHDKSAVSLLERIAPLFLSRCFTDVHRNRMVY